MVAPAVLPKPSHNLVKIPKTEPICRTGIVQLKRIRAGEKIQPIRPKVEPNQANDCNLPNTEKPSTCKQIKVLHPLSTTQSAISSDEPRRVNRQRLLSDASTSSSASTESSEQEDTPFWSLRSKNCSNVAPSCQDRPGSAKRKAYELEPLGDPRMERCRRNAINAKKNRELKKAQMAELEHKVDVVSRERDELAGENESLREAKLKLEQQVKHLSNILKNQSQLSALIGKLSPASVVLGDLSSTESDDSVISSASGR